MLYRRRRRPWDSWRRSRPQSLMSSLRSLYRCKARAWASRAPQTFPPFLKLDAQSSFQPTAIRLRFTIWTNFMQFSNGYSAWITELVWFQSTTNCMQSLDFFSRPSMQVRSFSERWIIFLTKKVTTCVFPLRRWKLRRSLQKYRMSMFLLWGAAKKCRSDLVRCFRILIAMWL